MPNVSTFDPGASFGAPFSQETPFEFADLQSAGFVAPQGPGIGSQLAGIGGSIAGAAASLIPVVGPLLGALVSGGGGIAGGLLGGGGGTGPDALLQAERQRNRTQSLQALTQLSGGSQDSGVLRAILQRFLFDQGFVGKLQIGVTEKGKPRTVQFKPGDIDALTKLGSAGVASKRGLEAFQRFTASEIVADALQRTVGLTPFSTFNVSPVAEDIRFRGDTQAARAESLDPFLPSLSALPGGAMPNVPTSPGGLSGFFEGVGDFIGGIFGSGGSDSGAQPGDIDFVGPVQDPAFGGYGPGFDFGDVIDFGKSLLPILPGVLPGLIGGGGPQGGGTAAMPGGATINTGGGSILNDPFGLFKLPSLLGGNVPSVPTTPGAGLNIQARQRTVTRLPHMVATVVPTPSGGSRVVAYRNMGRPVLWSGDFASARRVRKVAAKARRSRGGR